MGKRLHRNLLSAGDKNKPGNKRDKGQKVIHCFMITWSRGSQYKKYVVIKYLIVTTLLYWSIDQTQG